MTIVLAVDPGKTCGVALWYGDELQYAGEGAQHKLHMWAEETIMGYQDQGLEVVCEDFRLSPATLKTGSDWKYPTATIGVLKYWCKKYDVPFTLQPASQGKKFATDAKLKALDWYASTPGGHTNDALRHLLVYLVGKKLVTPPMV